MVKAKQAPAYATLADLYARFGEEEINQVADTDHTGTPAPELVGRALSDAASEIDAALAGRYALPLSPIPVLITRIACELAREALYADSPPKVVTERAKWARETLLRIASGQLRFENAAPDDSKSLTDAVVIPNRRKMRWPGQRTEDRGRRTG
jgi:phage gp36-like protein